MGRLAIVVAFAAGLGGCGRLGFGSSNSTAGDAGVDQAIDAEIDAAPQPNLMFVSSTTQDVCQTGVAGADAVCAARATARGFAGTYRAWYSDMTIDARDRFPGVRGWVRVDGKPFGDTVADIVAGRIAFPARIDDTGTDLGFATTQTSTNVSGQLSASGCMEGGITDRGGNEWGGGFLVGGGRITCLGADRDVAVTVTPATGRIAFVSSSKFDPKSGLAGADLLCSMEATAAQLPGTYKAFLPTTTATAASRFDLGGPPWVRTDGVQVVQNTADIATWKLLAPIERQANSSYVFVEVWTGTSTTTPTLASTCNDWGSMQPTGRTTDTTSSTIYGGGFDRACSQLRSVFCLQQ